MRRSLLTAALLALTMPFTSLPAFAEDKAVVEAMESYMDFVDYGGATIFPEQIPKDDWKNFFVIDARDSDQFLKDHIPGAVNIEWRRALAERSRIPKDTVPKKEVKASRTGQTQKQITIFDKILFQIVGFEESIGYINFVLVGVLVVDVGDTRI
jgi:hypothetical protein